MTINIVQSIIATVGTLFNKGRYFAVKPFPSISAIKPSPGSYAVRIQAGYIKLILMSIAKQPRDDMV
jgi:hypothetical protein